MAKIEFKPVRDDKKLPICPHCEKEMDNVRYFERKGLSLAWTRIFVCPHCFKVLGTGMAI